MIVVKIAATVVAAGLGVGVTLFFVGLFTEPPSLRGPRNQNRRSGEG